MITGIAHCLGGLVLLCAFLLLSQRRLAAMTTIYQLQAAAVAAAAFWQGFAQGAADLYLTALITLVIKAVLLPIGLRRIVRRFNLIRAVAPAMPVGLSMILGVALIGVAVLAVLPTTVQAVSPTREDLAIALAVVLLGFLLLTARRHALAQVIGFLSTENGLVLAAIGMPGMPLVAALSVALLVLTAGMLVGVFLLRIREHADTLDLGGIADIEGRGR